MATQKDIFLNGEADRWFQRNQSALRKGSGGFDEINWLCEQLLPFQNQINFTFEVGCSNGEKLRQVCQQLSCKGEGIDPSMQAVENGNAKGGVALHVGTASKLPSATGTFDFVFFGFCLYLLDRNELLAAIAEADRILKPGGFLAITDFDPAQRHKRPYHHKEGVYSFKQDYSTCFTNTGLYYLVAKNSFSHRRKYFDIDGNERVSTTLLYKELDSY